MSLFEKLPSPNKKAEEIIKRVEPYITRNSLRRENIKNLALEIVNEAMGVIDHSGEVAFDEMGTYDYWEKVKKKVIVSKLLDDY